MKWLSTTIKIFISICVPLIMDRSSLVAATDPPPDLGTDLAWDWTTKTDYKVFLSSHGEPPEGLNISAPMKTAGNILHDFTPDFHPKDGWMLVHKDFGTEKKGVPFPYFTIYNKYRGIFRVILYNGMIRDETYFIGQLAFLESERRPDRAAALFTFTNEGDGGFRATFNPTQMLLATSAMATYGSWAVFDFPLVGFDPDLEQRDPVLVFSLRGVETCRLRLEGDGSVHLVQDHVNNSNPGFSLTAGEIGKAGATGYKYYSDVKKWIKEEARNPKNKDEFWWDTMQTLLACTNLSSFAPVMAGLGGAVSSFVGGMTKAGPREFLSFTGQANFTIEGGIESIRNLWATSFRMVPGQPDHLGQRPLQAVPWGIFSIERRPLVPIKNIGDGGPWKIWTPLRIRLMRPTLQINQANGMDLVSVCISFGRRNIRKSGKLEAPTAFMDIEQAIDGYIFDIDHTFGEKMTWEFRFRTREPTLYSDNEIVFYKSTWLGALLDQ